ncbi:MAG TPA: glycosyltransferase [Coriobacteriia bacterium]
MRILIVTDIYSPARNGVAIWNALTVRELRARGHEVQVLTYRHSRRGEGDPAVTGIHEIAAPLVLDPDFRIGPVWGRLPASVRGAHWDVIHVHHPLFIGPAAARFARRSGARLVFTCHMVYTDYLDEYLWGLARPLKPWLTAAVRRFADGCDAVLVPASSVVRWMREIGVRARVEILEAPADTRRIERVPRAEARAALGLGDRPVALYVGRIADEKRVQELVHEFTAAMPEASPALLALGGTGHRTGAVRHEVEHCAVPGCVRILGALDADDLSLWYSAADVFVSASRAETGPLTLVEAMSCACPSVSYDASGFEDRVTDGVNGLLAQDRPGALGAAIHSVLGDPGLRARLAAGALAASQGHTPAAATDRLLSVYESLLA